MRNETEIFLYGLCREWYTICKKLHPCPEDVKMDAGYKRGIEKYRNGAEALEKAR